jgi:ubiquinone/menaquinone biosynthesis C-methylase UbiE
MMKRKGIHKPTIEDVIELSGIEALHPGGFALTKRTAELAGLKPGVKVLDVSSGRGTQSIYYAQEFGVEVVGLDIAEEMVSTATEKAKMAGVDNLVSFKLGDSQDLPFEDNSFDVVINECAVGIPDDSQKVLNEMVRVAKPGAAVVIHESTWREKLSDENKEEISERYGSKPEMFWKIRKDRDVKNHRKVLTREEMGTTIERIMKEYGEEGVKKALENEKLFWNTILSGKLGYCLFKGIK